MARSRMLFFALMCIALYSFDGVPSVEAIIVSRQEWGARPPTKNIAALNENPPRYVIIHHSKTQACETQASCIAKVNSIQDYHMDTKLWSDIAYNFLAGGDGNIYEGRGWEKSGAHAKLYNSKSIGICLIGNFTDTSPSSVQIAAVWNLIEWAAYNNKIHSNYTLLGHRQTAETNCPGNALFQRIQNWPHALKYVAGR